MKWKRIEKWKYEADDGFEVVYLAEDEGWIVIDGDGKVRSGYTYSCAASAKRAAKRISQLTAD